WALSVRVADFAGSGNILVARIRKLAAGDLRPAFEQMACQRSGGEPVPVVSVPSIGMEQGPKRKRGISDAASHDNVGALVQRLGDWLRAEIKIRRDDVARSRETGAADLAGCE